jgi:hypothetical protein
MSTKTLDLSPATSVTLPGRTNQRIMNHYIVCAMSDANPAEGRALSLAKRPGVFVGSLRTVGGSFS